MSMYQLLASLMQKATAARNFSFVGSCVSTSSALNFGALSAGAIAAGDILVYFDLAQSAAAPTTVTPSGFTVVSSTASGGPALAKGIASIKKATGSEGSVTGMNGDNNNKVGLVFRPSTSFTTITTAGVNGETSTGAPASQTCNPSAETTAVVLVAVAAADASTAAFTTETPALDAKVANGDADMLAGYKLYNTSPASHSFAMADLGINWLCSFYMTVS